MGCQHSTPIPTASDFYYLPTSRGLACMDESILRIENPGMCYSLRMHHVIQQQQSQITSSTGGMGLASDQQQSQDQLFQHQRRKRGRRSTCSRTHPESTTSNKTVSSSILILDEQNGVEIGSGLYIDCPSKKKHMLLRDGRGKIMAMLKSTIHPTFDFYYEIVCPKRPSQLRLPVVDGESSTSFSACSSSWSSFENRNLPNHHDSSLALDEEGGNWYTWGTVFQIPHKLEFQMTLRLPGESNHHRPHSSNCSLSNPLAASLDDDVDEELSYRLRYCGPVMGPCQMRIDKHDNAPVALISENNLHPTRQPAVDHHCISHRRSTALNANSTACAPVVSQKTKSSWNLVIGPGVDPCLMICFAAIVNYGRSYSDKRRR